MWHAHTHLYAPAQTGSFGLRAGIRYRCIPVNIFFGSEKLAFNFTVKKQGATEPSREIETCAVRNHEQTILDRFWQIRGVFDVQQRANLVACVDHDSRCERPKLRDASYEALPGVGAAARLIDPVGLAEVRWVSQQILQLDRLLGHRDDIDVISMITRQPRLLDVTADHILQCLLKMKVAAGDTEVDVGLIAATHPGLLLTDVAEISQLGGKSQVQAWRHGLSSNSDAAFAGRMKQLNSYRLRIGDAHVGFRDTDDAGLARWALAQRTSAAEGCLPADRSVTLELAGFELNVEEAEWSRWFSQLRQFHTAEGHSGVSPLASGDDFLMINWCSVQRIAKRSGILSSNRQQRLDTIGFDWTGADALS